MTDYLNKQLYVDDFVIVKYNSPSTPYSIIKIIRFTDKMVCGYKCKNIDDISSNENKKPLLFYGNVAIKINVVDAINFLQTSK